MGKWDNRLIAMLVGGLVAVVMGVALDYGYDLTRPETIGSSSQGSAGLAALR